MIDYNKDVVFVQDYVFNTQITEYDIQSAGLSILEASGALDDEKVKELSGLSKNNRVVTIGLMIRDNPEYQKIIKEGLISARKNFIEGNNLSDGDIICIKKDAIFTTRKCTNLEFNGIKFRAKTRWRSYLKLGKIEFLYLDKTKYQILGLGESATDYHREGWVATIIDVIDRISNGESVGHKMINLVWKYRDGSMDERFYHMFRSDPTPIDPMYNFKEIIQPLMSVLGAIGAR